MRLQNKLLIIILLSGVFFYACTTGTSAPASAERPLSAEVKEYWFSGLAELSSYNLHQARYGEMRDGEAVLIFVTEDFSPKSGTKADRSDGEAVSVLKLNATKKFLTGIYPYSMMSSTFFPMQRGGNSLKVSASSQEWCGHTYMELFERDDAFEVQVASYFEGESGRTTLGKSLLEDDVWSMIRLAPEALPTGELKAIPSFFYLRLMHKEIKAYQAVALTTHEGIHSTYSIDYPELERSLKITYDTAFPHRIVSWEETYPDGFGDKQQKLTTTATLQETIRTKYWQQNSVADTVWRDSLRL